VCLVEGRLIFKSGFLPRTLGLLLQIAGVCYLTNSFASIIYPSLDLFPYILLPPFIAELSLALWLVVKGIDVTKWNQMQAKGNA
jgi:hypothetical protein